MLKSTTSKKYDHKFNLMWTWHEGSSVELMHWCLHSNIAEWEHKSCPVFSMQDQFPYNKKCAYNSFRLYLLNPLMIQAAKNC